MDETLKIFFLETTEILEEMESSLMRLEQHLDDSEALNSVFRAAHTIKGSAGIVGYEDIEQFTHDLENILDMLRNKELKITSEIVETLLQCRDHIVQMLSAYSDGSGDSENIGKTGGQLYARLLSLRSANNEPSTQTTISPTIARQQIEGIWHISARFSKDLLRDAMDPIAIILQLKELGKIIFIKFLTDSIPPSETMNPETCYIALEMDLKANCTEQDILDAFEFVEDGSTINILPPDSPKSAYMELIESLPEDNNYLQELILKGGGMTAASRLTTRADIQQPVNTQSSTAKKSTIRVDTEKLDKLINSVGELVISGAAIKEEAYTSGKAKLKGLTDILTRLIEEIRDNSMSVRMTPVLGTFTRFKRVLRDMCHETGKDVDLIIKGGETELDRTVIEKINDPLVHLVRNAMDHGIESPAKRVSRGKSQRGRIILNAYQDTGDIVIEVVDDGEGIDTDVIAAKAVEKGLAKSTEGLGESEIFDFIFEPGFSTATKVTNISGRGVGMDVVKRNIQALKGSVELESLPGWGTTARVRLPLTLAIIEGFLVSVGDAKYVVPMDSVIECLELTEADIKAAHGREHVNLRGSIMPYINLHSIFETTSKEDRKHILVVRSNTGQNVGIMVDKLEGEVQAVIKSLGKYYSNVTGVSGATILGDGSVALIIDIPSLVTHATKAASEQ